MERPDKMNRHWPWLLLILAVYSAVQLVIIYFSPIDSDNAIIGLMARHISQGRDFPVFWYGQPFMGALEAYLAAFYFLLLGPGRFALYLAPFTFSLVFLAAVYFLAREYAGPKSAVWAVLLAACPSAYAANFYLAPRGGYVESLALGSLILLFLRRIIYGPRSGARLNYFWLGLFLGLLFWTIPLFIYFLATLLVFLFLKDKLFFARPVFLVFILAFVLGSLPFWLACLATGFVPLLTFVRTSHPPGEAFRHLQYAVKVGLPRLLGLRRPEFLPLSLAAAAFFAGAFGWLLYRQRRGWRQIMTRLSLVQTSGREILVFFLFVTVAVFSLSRFGGFERPRYLLPFLAAWPVLLAYCLVEIKSRFGWFFALGLGLALGPCLYQQAGRLPELFRLNERLARTTGRLQSQLLADGPARLYANYWQAYVLDFETRENIIASEITGSERYPAYGLAVNAADRPAFLLTGQEDLAAQFSALGGSWQERGFPGLGRLLYDWRPPADIFQTIDRSNWRIVTADPAVSAGLALDRRAGTSWALEPSDQADNFLVLDLGRSHRLARVEILPDILPAKTETTHPGSVEVLTSTDGLTWSSQARLRDCLGNLFWSGPHPFFNEPQGRIEISFPAIPARYLKLRLASRRGNTAIREIFLAEAAGHQDRSDFWPAGLGGWLEKNRPELVLTDFWLSSKIKEVWSGRLSVLPSANELSYLDRPPYRKLDRLVRLTDRTVIIVEAGAAAALTGYLRQENIGFRQTVLGELTLVHDFSSNGQNYFWTGRHLINP